ncbi:hypothetical protein [Jannaschia aquimarina]|uniref:Uncharacterized protein n=1 Tax=Jannaschia aquimarina TaxID=935700 RepID=A0A0D1CR63_9RHOB|nr:hypothetical protein [Jannaschia aquimarina]KIT17262.1 hypothetical protein jaqu_09930 [Jannaschia aquimarina]SNT19255.1 hypothetical protein SAMN05421775_107119 [Jannaschia aquimarina]
MTFEDYAQLTPKQRLEIGVASLLPALVAVEASEIRLSEADDVGQTDELADDMAATAAG